MSEPLRANEFLISNGFKCVIGDPYKVWRKQYINKKEHNCYRLILIEDEIGYSITIASCCASYAGDENAWHGVMLGNLHAFFAPFRFLFYFMEVMHEPV